VPVLVKDNYDTADMPTTASSLSLAGSRPPRDAATIRKLRDAGAIVLAKANLTEFALTGITFGSLGGQTRNPYELGRTPGGSSGGTGAALAANFGLVGTGTDTVNSIRSPSSANSVVGIRPTAGLVSRAGIVPVSSTQDAAGPLARTVRDVATVLSVMDGYDTKDPISAATSSTQGRCAARASVSSRASWGRIRPSMAK
jgi:Asp-tRNA(Asn)/Glu-tRNA(Gln) amidotransferase A subunit family amidase